MTGKRKSAPNLKEINKKGLPPQHEIFMLVGENVWNFYRSEPKNGKTNGQGLSWQRLADSTDSDNPERYTELPIVIDERELNKIQQWELLPNNHEVASLIDVSGFFALKSSENGINIRMITQGPEELNIIVGVDSADFEKAIRVLYNSFVK